VLTRDGQVERNLMWKDTVLVRIGEVVDILLDVQSRAVDGALPHRRAPRERDDVQLRRRGEPAGDSTTPRDRSAPTRNRT
jgi:hypothetical protein